MDDPDPLGGLFLGAIPPLHSVVFGASLLLVILAVVAGTAVRNFRWSRLERMLADKVMDSVAPLLREERTLLDSLLVLRVFGSIVLLLSLVGGFPFGESKPLDSVGFLEDLGIGLLVFLVGIHGIVRGVVRAIPERSLLVVMPLLGPMVKVVSPLRWVLDAITGIFTRALGLVDDEDEAHAEILDAVSEGEYEGALADEEREMIESIIDFRNLEASEVMTPRTSMFGLSIDTQVADAVAAIVEQGHSRVPLFGENLDDLKGVLYAKDLLSLWAMRGDTMPTLRELMRVPTYVPETKNCLELLRQLRDEKIHMAIVLDEYGGTAGLVTIEDILEEIVGDIEDEFDRTETGQLAPINFLSETEVDMSARVRIDEINEAMALTLPGEEGYDTIGGFLFSKLGRLPVSGETFDFANIHFEVTDADERRINRVKVTVGA